MVLHDDDGRQVVPRAPYSLIEPMIRQHYIEQDARSGRLYRISYSGMKSANS
jgi:hypothetical protein